MLPSSSKNRGLARDDVHQRILSVYPLRFEDIAINRLSELLRLGFLPIVIIYR